MKYLGFILIVEQLAVINQVMRTILRCSLINYMPGSLKRLNIKQRLQINLLNSIHNIKNSNAPQYTHNGTNNVRRRIPTIPSKKHRKLQDTTNGSSAIHALQHNIKN